MTDSWTFVRQSPLHNRLRDAGGNFETQDSWLVVRNFGDLDAEVEAVRTRVGIFDLSWTRKWQVRGRMLDTALVPNVSQEVPEPGRLSLTEMGCLCRISPGEALFLLQDQRPEIQLGSDDSDDGGACVHVLERTDGYAMVVLCGPDASLVLGKLTALDLREKSCPDGTCAMSPLAGITVLVVRWDQLQVPCYQLLVSTEYAEYLWDVIVEAGDEFGLRPCGMHAWVRLGE